MERALRHTHTIPPGPSILELLEAELTEACTQYLVLRAAAKEAPDTYQRSPRTIEARGRVRGLAISIAMMRHPLRRHEVVWWNYVKKLEKRHILKARESDNAYLFGGADGEA